MSARYGLIGFPVKHSYSAIMQNAAFEELDIEARYDLFEVKPAELEERFRALIAQGVCGFNITVPYKEKIIKFLDQLDEEAALIEAVNTVKVQKDKTLRGFNTDGLGFITHLTKVVGFTPQGKNISILGAGGAAKAVATQLAKSQAKSISFFDVKQDKAKDLISKLQRNFSNCSLKLVLEPDALLQDRTDLFINATPVGMRREDGLVFSSQLLRPRMVVYDLVYNPAETLLLREAKIKGCVGVFNGLGMLLYQGALAFKIWLDIEPPMRAMDEAIREVLLK